VNDDDDDDDDEDKQTCLKRDSKPRSERPRNQGLRIRKRGHWDQMP
jgi:hypothetical protein